ncbi:alpha/beta-hydrolase family protein [Williamsia sp. MIQD14]|uniref:alpha/beta-hydrolase family protein n=1 Tax=Williamsia sp. MIQD14 TaxID=3425703 RepID=UPI003DA0B724
MRTPVRHPSRAELVGVAAGALAAAVPGSLPREALVHAATSAVLTAAGAAIGCVAVRLRIGAGAAGRVTVVATTVVVVSSLVVTVWWQNVLRTSSGAPVVGTVWAAPSVTAVATVAAVLVAPRAALTLAVAITFAGSDVAQATARPPVTAGVPVTIVATGPSDRTAITEPFDRRPIVERARRLVERWRSAGGADRAAVVVAVPTGSGWVDADALTGFDRRLGGDVATIALPYADAPSWQAFAAGAAAAARESAVALVAALDDDLRSHPAPHHPQVYLYGQSLGAIGADAARVWARGHGVTICSTVLAGPPADTVAPRADDRRVVVNASDPVARWSVSLLWRPAHLWPGHADLPRPPWVPAVSFLQTSVDLLGALSLPTGHGHRYGPEQSANVPICGPGGPSHPGKA